MKYRPIVFIFILVVLITSVGTLGYIHIEEWDAIDAFYMAIITLTTTGFQEVHSLSPQGRIFTIGLLIFGVGTVGYSITVIMNEVLSIDFQSRRRKKMFKQINDLENHIIICGYGRMGKVVCSELDKHGKEFVVIEQNKECIENLKNTEFLWLEGDATHDDALKSAGIVKAKVLVSMLDSDADSLYLSLAGRGFNKDLHIISRASEESAGKKIRRAGADKVIMPIVNSALKIAESILDKSFEDLVELSGIYLDQESRIKVSEVTVNSGSSLVNKSIKDCGEDLDSLIIVGVRKLGKEFVYRPKSSYEFETNDTLVVLSTHDHLERVSKTFNLS